MTTRTDNVECCSKWAKKLLRWIDRGSRSITVSPSSSNLFFELAKVATLQHTFERDLIQNLATEAEFAALLFFFSFWPKSFRREKPAFSRGQTSSKKKTGSPSFAFSCSHTAAFAFAAVVVDHHYYLSQIECKDISFFFSQPIFTNNFFRDLPRITPIPEFRLRAPCRGYCVEFSRWIPPSISPRRRSTTTLFFFPLHLAGPVG